MKRGTKVWLWIAGGLVLLGVILLLAALALNQWDFSALGGVKLETRTVDIVEAFENISIVTDTEDLVFLPSDDGTSRAVLYEEKDTTHLVSVENGTLRIETVDNRGWRFSLFSPTPKVTLYLSQNDYAALAIEETTGEISIPRDFTFGSVDIQASTGNIECAASSAGEVQLRASTGNIRVENCSVGALKLSVSTGRVDVSAVACAGDADVRVSTGDTNLTDVTCRCFTSDGSTGDMTLKNVIASDKLSVERSTGDLRLEQCDAAELEIRTDTGDVTGSLRSAKVFVVRSDTGRIEVPETTTGGKCKITTDTGDIRIVIS